MGEWNVIKSRLGEIMITRMHDDDDNDGGDGGGDDDGTGGTSTGTLLE